MTARYILFIFYFVHSNNTNKNECVLYKSLPYNVVIFRQGETKESENQKTMDIKHDTARKRK